jgi:uncharacterized protein (DUF433 family)
MMFTDNSVVYHPQDISVYTIAEAARYLHIAPATLRSWVVGRPYPREDETGFFEPLIQLPDTPGRYLSFSNLVEAHVLRALRTEHGASIKAVRTALEYASEIYGIQRVLLSSELRTTAGELFLDKYGELVNLSRAGQLALRMVLEAHLKRVEWEQDLPKRLYPFLGRDFFRDDENARVIAIDPAVSFGRPVVFSKGISTAVIADRIDAGESLENVARDYDLEQSEVRMAIYYERAA